MNIVGGKLSFEACCLKIEGNRKLRLFGSFKMYVFACQMITFPNGCQILLSSLYSNSLVFSYFGYLNYEAATYFQLL
jgi:hypothetical protein